MFKLLVLPIHSILLRSYSFLVEIDVSN